jgi:hypothetical protein
LFKLIMHAPWCIVGCSSNIFHQRHMQRTSMAGSKALFCRKIMEACEAKEHGHDCKQRHQVEGPIMQAKEWMREFWWCKPWSTLSLKSQSKDECAGRKPEPGGARSHPGQSAQAGRPPPYLSTLALPFGR